jgi:Putative Actinobacterial Holin-X, holin superfamily III
VNPALIQIATDLVTSLLAARNQTPARWGLLAAGGVVGLIGGIYLTIAADLALSQYWNSPPLGAAAVGGALVLVSLILYLVGRRHQRLSQARQPELPLAVIAEFGAHLMGEFEGVIQESPKTSTAAAFAAGCIIGANTGRKRGLGDLIR